MSQRTEIDAQLFVASFAEDNERNWTLATRLGDILDHAERRFGPRDTSYTFLGIEFAGDRPMIRYPHNKKQIIIQLSLDCLTDLPRACYQLGHECIHLLAPTGRADANNLEEGLATLFGESYATHWFGMPAGVGEKPYEDAKTVTDKALKANPDLIRELRKVKPCFCDFTPQDLVKSTNLTRAEAEFLCRQFVL